MWLWPIFYGEPVPGPNFLYTTKKGTWIWVFPPKCPLFSSKRAVSGGGVYYAKIKVTRALSCYFAAQKGSSWYVAAWPQNCFFPLVLTDFPYPIPFFGANSWTFANFGAKSCLTSTKLCQSLQHEARPFVSCKNNDADIIFSAATRALPHQIALFWRENMEFCQVWRQILFFLKKKSSDSTARGTIFHMLQENWR